LFSKHTHFPNAHNVPTREHNTRSVYNSLNNKGNFKIIFSLKNEKNNNNNNNNNNNKKVTTSESNINQNNVKVEEEVLEENEMKEILEKIERTVTLDKRAIESNTMHLILDCLACPYISDKFKKRILTTLIDQYDIPNKKNKTEILAELSSPWFINWDSQINLEKSIAKKGLKFTY